MDTFVSYNNVLTKGEEGEVVVGLAAAARTAERGACKARLRGKIAKSKAVVTATMRGAASAVANRLGIGEGPVQEGLVGLDLTPFAGNSVA